jgi:hypothetical protein
MSTVFINEDGDPLDDPKDFTPIELESEIEQPSDEEIKEIERLNAEAVQMNAEAEAEAEAKAEEEAEAEAKAEEEAEAKAEEEAEEEEAEVEAEEAEEAEPAVIEAPIITDPLKTENIVIPSKQLLESNRIIQQLRKRNRFTLHTADLNRLKQIIIGEGLTCEDPMINEKKSRPDLTLMDQDNVQVKVNFVLCNHADVDDRTKWYVHLYFFEVEHPTIKSAIVDFFLGMDELEDEDEEPEKPLEEPEKPLEKPEEPLEKPEEPEEPLEKLLESVKSLESEKPLEPLEPEKLEKLEKPKPYTFYPMKEENESYQMNPPIAKNSLEVYRLRKELDKYKKLLQTYKRPYDRSDRPFKKPFSRQKPYKPTKKYKRKFHTRRGKKPKRQTRRKRYYR